MPFLHKLNTLFSHFDVKELQNDDADDNDNIKYGFHYVCLS